MKKTVRDDIIGLESYVDAEFKYKKYIEILGDCGGYCFLDQFNTIFKDDGGKYLKDKMIDSYLLTSSRYSKFKILRLSSNASKYLHYRDDEKDYSNIPKNKITINSLSDYPSQKVLFTSAMYFELYSKTKKDFFRKSKHIEMLENEFKSPINKQIDKLKQKIETLENIKIYGNHINKNFFKDLNSLNSKAIDNFDRTINFLKKEREMEKENITKFYKSNKKAETRIEFLDETINLINDIEINHNKILGHYSDFMEVIEEKCDLWISERREKINSHEKELEKIDEIIEKIIHFRDVSKLLCYVENKTLHVHNAFLDFSKKRKAYFELTKDLIELIAEYSRNSSFQIEIKRVKYYFYSPLREREYLERTFETLEEFYEKKEFQFEEQKLSSSYIPKITMKVDFEFQKIPRLKKYFEDMDIHSDYVKRKDAEDFDAFKEFLKKGRTRK